jgi:nucleoside-diphosphate-sugar epimerase
VENFFRRHRPSQVVLAAAKVGGILANSERPADFIRENLAIQSHVIDACHRRGVRKLVFLGSSCIYPKFAPQPIAESALLSGPLEPTNEAYAIAKIAGIKMCAAYNRQYGTNFLSLMPTNLYGPGDHYDPRNSHVLPALIRKVHEAKVEGRDEIVVWGTGTPRRELMHADDLASACVFALDKLNASDIGECINVGTGIDHTIREIAETESETLTEYENLTDALDERLEHDEAYAHLEDTALDYVVRTICKDLGIDPNRHVWSGPGVPPRPPLSRPKFSVFNAPGREPKVAAPPPPANDPAPDDPPESDIVFYDPAPSIRRGPAGFS